MFLHYFQGDRGPPGPVGPQGVKGEGYPGPQVCVYVYTYINCTLKRKKKKKNWSKQELVVLVIHFQLLAQRFI